MEGVPIHTQVRRLDQAAAMVLDAASMLDDQPPEGFSVSVLPVLSEVDEQTITEAKRARAEREVVAVSAKKATALASAWAEWARGEDLVFAVP